MGAGILPVSICKGTIFFLMGSERIINKENNVRNKKLWCDFGGSQINSETDLDIAIREGYEELNGILGNEKVLKDKIINKMINKFHWNRYTTYLFEIEKDDFLIDHFSNINSFAEKYFESDIYIDNGLFEKTEIKWFTIQELEKEKKNFRSFYRNIIELLINDYNIIKKDIEEKNYYSEIDF